MKMDVISQSNAPHTKLKLICTYLL